MTQLSTLNMLSEVKVSYDKKYLSDYIPDVTAITSPETAVNIFRAVWPETLELKESFYTLLLDNAKNAIGIYHTGTGGGTAVVVDPADVMRIALIAGASSFVIAHNHPSGQLKESTADVRLTHRIDKAGKLLSVQLDDHIILTKDSFLSLREKGII